MLDNRCNRLTSWLCTGGPADGHEPDRTGCGCEGGWQHVRARVSLDAPAAGVACSLGFMRHIGAHSCHSLLQSVLDASGAACNSISTDCLFTSGAIVALAEALQVAIVSCV